MKEQNPNHPIPLDTINNIDVLTSKKDGSVVLQIVTTGKLMADEETISRLIDKITNYLDIIHCEEFIEEFGAPSKENMIISISCTHKPEPPIIDLIKQLESHVENHDASIHLVCEGGDGNQDTV